MQVPPEFARHINPQNPLQMQLLQRVDRLTPQDLQAINTGVSQQAALVLKKLLPEIGFFIDMIGKAQSGGGQASGMAHPVGGLQPSGAPGVSNMISGMRAPMSPADTGGMPRPTTKLGGLS